MRRWKLYFHTSKTTIQGVAKYIPAFKPGKQLQAVVMDKVSKAS
jgi:nucleoid DNA-binding protein